MQAEIPFRDEPTGALVHVIGATGRSGLVLCRALMNAGATVVPLVRDVAKWAAAGLPGTARVIDLEDPASLAQALGDAVRVVSCGHARHTAAVLAASPVDATFVLMGSTRRFTQWPDEHGDGVIAGETAFLASGRRGVMLHPTMIYGAAGENNVQRLAALLRRLPVVPLPGGGRALVQPIYQDDLTRCILAALTRKWDGPNTLVVSGPAALPYADFVRAVALAARLGPKHIVHVPMGALLAVAPLLRFVPGLPRVGRDEIRRLGEDKAFDTVPMWHLLGVEPRPLAEGLRAMFTKSQELPNAGP